MSKTLEGTMIPNTIRFTASWNQNLYRILL